MSIHPSFCPFVHHPSVHSFIHLSIHPPIHSFIHLSIHLSIHPSIHPSICLFIHLSVHSSSYRDIPVSAVHSYQLLSSNFVAPDICLPFSKAETSSENLTLMPEIQISHLHDNLIILII